MDILRDPLWQFFGALFAFVAITITLIIYFLQRKRKKINYEIVSRLPLLSFREELEGKFKIYYEDNLVKNVYSIIINFYNTGNQPIASSDFERSLSIIFKENTKILAYSIIKTEPNNLDVQLILDNNKLTIIPLLLNPKDTFTIRAITTEAESEINLDYRIIGINKIIKGSPIQTTYFIYSLLGFVLTIVGLIISFTGSKNIDKSPFESLQSTIGFIVFSSGYILALGSIMLRKKMINKIIYFLRKFSR